LRDLWFQYVPKKMKEQEFWRRYFIAVKSIRQEVIDGECENAIARSWSNLEQRLTFGGIGAEVCTLTMRPCFIGHIDLECQAVVDCTTFLPLG
jgi:hypothetical protein